MDKQQSLSKQIGALKDKQAKLQAALPRAKNIDEYDSIARAIETLDYQIEILRAQRDLARMEQAR